MKAWCDKVDTCWSLFFGPNAAARPLARADVSSLERQLASLSDTYDYELGILVARMPIEEAATKWRVLVKATHACLHQMLEAVTAVSRPTALGLRQPSMAGNYAVNGQA